jgi:hypothetical protein
MKNKMSAQDFVAQCLKIIAHLEARGVVPGGN